MRKAIGIVLILVFIAGAVFSGVMFAKQYGDAKESEGTFSELQELAKDPAVTTTPQRKPKALPRRKRPGRKWLRRPTRSICRYTS